ncbi:MAG: DUF5305 family protein [Haloarculaceae archaeon]
MTTFEDASTTDRVRYLLASNLTSIVVGCLLLAAVGGAVAVQVQTGPETTTEQRTAGGWTPDGGFEHSALVRNGSRAFSEGERLRNRSVYFTRAAPILDGAHVFTHSGGADPATVSTDVRLVVRAVEGTDDDTTVLWRVSESIASAEDGRLEPGESHRVPFSVNVTAQSELASAVEEQLGTTRGRTEILVVAETSAETTLAGESESVTRVDRLRVSVSPGTYSVSRDLAAGETVTVTETVRVPVEPDPLREYGSLAALLVGLGGAGVVVGLHRTGRLALPQERRVQFAREQTRESYAEWISVGHVPPVGDDERVVTVDALVDVVDVAIDSDRRVIEDRDTGEFVVLDGEIRYVHDPSADVTRHAREGRDPLASVGQGAPEDSSTESNEAGADTGESSDSGSADDLSN